MLDTETFLSNLKAMTYLEEGALIFASRRLQSLLETIKFLDSEEIIPLTMVFTFSEIMTLFTNGFKVIFEPYYDTGKKISPTI